MESFPVPKISSFPTIMESPAPGFQESQCTISGKEFRRFFKDWEPKDETGEDERNQVDTEMWRTYLSFKNLYQMLGCINLHHKDFAAKALEK